MPRSGPRAPASGPQWWLHSSWRGSRSGKPRCSALRRQGAWQASRSATLLAVAIAIALAAAPAAPAAPVTPALGPLTISPEPGTPDVSALLLCGWISGEGSGARKMSPAALEDPLATVMRGASSEGAETKCRDQHRGRRSGTGRASVQLVLPLCHPQGRRSHRPVHPRARPRGQLPPLRPRALTGRDRGPDHLLVPDLPALSDPGPAVGLGWQRSAPCDAGQVPAG